MIKNFHFTILTGILFNYIALNAQSFSRADSLRGALRPERTCFDVTYYDLKLQFDLKHRMIQGSNTIYAIKTEESARLQIDLFEELTIHRIVDYHGNTLNFVREGRAVFIDIPKDVKTGDRFWFEVFYSGVPLSAKMPPWDGGFVWSKDAYGTDWVGVACEGIGASLWWPNKDHLSDEPDSMRMAFTIPANLKAISNGQQIAVLPGDNYTTYVWKVTYPINNYNVTFYIGDYVNWRDTYEGKQGPFTLNFYVLKDNFEKSKKHFQQVKPMLDCYEKFLGPYPFPRDGFALVEAPYLGMEHQSAIAYGNKYKPGYDGMDFSMLGLTFDYIIIHETGHEYWGNSVSMKDIADMWIHEGFCTYTEAIYIECIYGADIALKYVNSWKYRVMNDEPVIGQYNVNHEGSTDMYYKGALMLHTLRWLVNDDELWWNCLRSIQKDFRFKTTDTQELVAYINSKLNKDYTWLFEQYLKKSNPPVLDIRFKKKGKGTLVACKWDMVVPNFQLPVTLLDDAAGKTYKIPCNSGILKETYLPVSITSLRIDEYHAYFIKKYE
ncbi:MAG: M1 family metallopeptidase [Flavobacteriales bacterium]|nr:M1 family metallopeptidase [Flavobacteriales bacterium]